MAAGTGTCSVVSDTGDRVIGVWILGTVRHSGQMKQASC